MQQPFWSMLCLALLVLGQAAAHSVVGHSQKDALQINPPLKDVVSDKKFFGPNGDYSKDTRPVVQKSIMDKLKGPGQPYPALQSKDKFDTDFVKDENSDKGAWKAQFEYDALQKKVLQEEAEEKAAQGKANKEGKDVDDAQKKADDASKNAKDAQDGVDAAQKSDASAGGDTGAEEKTVAAPSAEALEKLKKQVAEAEANYEKEKKDFEECKKQLEEAKKNVEELKAAQAEMEQKLQGETKLWMETKTVRLDLKKAKQEAASAKRVAAEARLKVVQNTKADLDKILAKEKAESDQARQNVLKQKADLAQAEKDMAAATLRLQKLRGYAVDAPAAESSAPATSMWSRWFR